MEEKMEKGNMNQVAINRDKLLNIIKENREKYNLLYEASMSGHYKELGKELGKKWDASHKMIDEYTTKMEELRKTGKFSLSFKTNFSLCSPKFNSQPPQSYHADYDKAIRMLELTEHEIFVLNTQEFDRYVMNNWEWKSNFISTTSNLITGSAIYTSAFANPILGSGISYKTCLDNF